MRVWPGRPYPLGATWDGLGVNFALFSENAERVELELFDWPQSTEGRRVELSAQTDGVFHVYLPDVLPGQLYGYRVHGPHDPANGHRFNANKLLLDPYAKLVGRDLEWDDSLYGYPIGGGPDADLEFDPRDSAAFAPLAAVADGAFTWGDDRKPGNLWHDTLIYELHVKGFTKRLPGVPDKHRGTYAGVASEAAVDHLLGLNVTAVELLPVQFFTHDKTLVDRGLSNYWGYNTLGFFAPNPRYAANPDRAVVEFKTMVRTLHAAGIEVIMDVVYNHTAEGNQFGPTLSWRGVDNAAYYYLSPEDPRYYMDFSGCGNCPRMGNPRVLQLIMDSLRYWVTEMRVDGFRFDLAPVLVRESLEVDVFGSFLDIARQDPVLNTVKLIAEPWDTGPNGYMVGKFPGGWAEWNGQYRDTIRGFWAGEPVPARTLAHRLCGSPDLYDATGRRPHASVNFVTCHDGFSLNDLCSYKEKHNEANGEENRDGDAHNRSTNGGVEGPTDDPAVTEARERQKRNLMATLMLSQGVPMLLAGDEVGHTQQGNNNTYCQDSDLSWVNWEGGPRAEAMLAFARRLTRVWHDNPVLKRTTFPKGRSIRNGSVHDVNWFTPAGKELTDGEWEKPAKSLGMRLAGDRIGEVDERGEAVVGETLFVALNAGPKPVKFALPACQRDQAWELILDTAADGRHAVLADGSEAVAAGSVAVFRTRPRDLPDIDVTPLQAEAMRRRRTRPTTRTPRATP
jgi:isoamylase